MATRRRDERSWRVPVSIVAGPWPFYPSAVVLIVGYSMIVRSAVRMLSQPIGAPAWTAMVPSILLNAVLTALTAWALMRLAPAAVARIAPLHGRPSGRARYLLTLFVVVLGTTAMLVVVRVTVPDGALPPQIPPAGVAFATMVVVVLAVYVTNGVVGYAVDRLRRQEEIVRAERSLLLAAEERVRSDTARFLHDAMQSALLRASMRLVMLERSAADGTREELRGVIDEIDRVRDDGVRGASRRLSPPLVSTGLIVALWELCESYEGVMVVDMTFDDPAAERFRMVADDDRAAMAVYRIAEQALQNALKHGHATNAVVAVMLDGDRVVLTVTADGEAPAWRRTGGSGSAIINAWLDDVGGHWALRPDEDGGSVLRAVIGR